MYLILSGHRISVRIKSVISVTGGLGRARGNSLRVSIKCLSVDIMPIEMLH